jgi:hypothetical protein
MCGPWAERSGDPTTGGAGLSLPATNTASSSALDFTDFADTIEEEFARRERGFAMTRANA